MSAKRRKALGRGIKDLIPDLSDLGRREQLHLGIEQLTPLSIGQPRKQAARDIDDLVASVREQGVLQPLWVRRQGDRFEIIAGERRWRAAQKAGRSEVPAIEFSGLTDDQVLILALVENLQREDLNAIEEAESYRRLSDQWGLTQEAIASRIGKQRATVANALRLLDLPGEVKTLVRQGRLSAGHARALLGLKDPKQITAAAREVLRRGLSVRDTEKMAAGERKARGRRRAPKKQTSAQMRAVVEKLQRVVGARVRIVESNNRGRIEIAYSSAAERERLIALLQGNG